MAAGSPASPATDRQWQEALLPVLPLFGSPSVGRRFFYPPSLLFDLDIGVSKLFVIFTVNKLDELICLDLSTLVWTLVIPHESTNLIGLRHPQANLSPQDPKQI